MSQNEMILEYLRTHKEEGITPKEALNHIGCMRLSARIHDLRAMGYDIVMDLVDVPIRGGRKTKVSRYKLNG